MVGPEVLSRYRVVNHDAHDPATLASAGTGADGQPVLMNRHYVEADRRIVLGFIEPHFMAGFSGGFKGIFPAVADIASIMRYHDAKTIGHPREHLGRPRRQPDPGHHPGERRAPAPRLLRQPDPEPRPADHPLLLRRRCEAAHEAGCAFSKETAMVACAQAFPIVVTTNSGYPLDQNLYQTVKGMSAAAQVVAQGGYIAAAARCNDGFPAHGNFKKLLFDHPSPRALLDTIEAPGFSMYDQWEAQLLALIQLKARVGLYSELPGARR